MLTFNPCILIPCYKHGKKLGNTLESLRFLGLPVIVVDDGNPEEEASLINNAINSYLGEVEIVRLPVNSGKGDAVIRGAELAARLGYSHFLQIDADGQHDALDASKFLILGKEFPSDLISGKPVFDDSVPCSRQIGRYLTHIWVYIETLSFQIKDSFCGFRLYPTKTFLDIVKKEHVGKRMDFDIEIMVRFFWRGLRVQFIPTKVIYPKDGSSNFDLLADNWRITKMHSRLFFESLRHWPVLLSKKNTEHWAQEKERRGLYGMMFLVWVYQHLGRTIFRFLLAPVVLVFWLSGSRQRNASREFLQRVEEERARRNLPHERLTSLKHFFNFGDCILDKLSAWSEDWTYGKEFKFVDSESREVLTARPNTRGKLLFVSHLGMAETCRAIAQKQKRLVINALVFDQNAKRMSKMLKQLNSDSSVHLIPVQNVSIETAVLLEEKINRGEWVAIAADRVPVTDTKQRTVKAKFLGKEAHFPIGPFILASLLTCEVATMFVIKSHGKFLVEARSFASEIKLDRKHRDAQLEHYVRRYAAELERKAVQYPLNWFNFYDFWSYHTTQEGVS